MASASESNTEEVAPTRKTRPEEWGSLPAEIHREIWKHLAASHEGPPRQRGLAAYTGIGSGWQEFFESYTFRNIVLRSSDLPKFQGIIDGKRCLQRLSYITKIYFIIELPPYDCSSCGTAEGPGTIFDNQSAFYHYLLVLLETLSWWTAAKWEEASERGIYDLKGLSYLDLYLGIMSPSDCQHRVNDIRFDKNYPFWFECEADFQDMQRNVHGR